MRFSVGHETAKDKKFTQGPRPSSQPLVTADLGCGAVVAVILHTGQCTGVSIHVLSRRPEILVSYEQIRKAAFSYKGSKASCCWFLYIVVVVMRVPVYALRPLSVRFSPALIGWLGEMFPATRKLAVWVLYCCTTPHSGLIYAYRSPAWLGPCRSHLPYARSGTRAGSVCVGVPRVEEEVRALQVYLQWLVRKTLVFHATSVALDPSQRSRPGPGTL